MRNGRPHSHSPVLYQYAQSESPQTHRAACCTVHTDRKRDEDARVPCHCGSEAICSRSAHFRLYCIFI